MQCLTPHKVRLCPVVGTTGDTVTHQCPGPGSRSWRQSPRCWSLPCLCCQHEPFKTCMGRGDFTPAEQSSGGSREGKSRLMTIRGINALSSVTPIQILTWRAARFPEKQVIQSSCCPVMIFSLPRLPPQTQSRSLSACWGFLRPPQAREGQSSLPAYSFGCLSFPNSALQVEKCRLCSVQHGRAG